MDCPNCLVRRRDRAADRLLLCVLWLGFDRYEFGGVIYLVASYITPIYQYGWGAVVFAGIGFACAITIVASGALVAWRYFNPLPKQPATSASTQSGLARRVPLIDHDRSFLFLAGGEIWKAKIIFSHGGGVAQVCLDFSSSSGGVGQGFWRACRRFQLRQIANFTKDQEITIELMALDDSQPRRFWHWTIRDGGDVLVHTMNRCRLALIVDDRVADDFSFIVVPCHDGGEGLLLIGENHFAFAREWREKDVARNDDTT